MQKKSTSKVLALFLMVALLLGMVVNTSNASVGPVEATQALDKVEPAVLEAMSTKGSSDFVVEMAEHADLKAAYAIKDWSERGWYVYNNLKEVADRTQKPIIQMLDQKGIKYQSFFAGNEIAVTAGDMTTLSQIAALDSVEHIRYPRTAYIDPITSLSKDLFNFTVQSLAWGITDTNADEFWSTFGMQGEGIVVANIDTGVQWNHPALDQAFKCGTDPSDPACWADPSNVCGGQACDNNGHGTHTMGTMVGDNDPTLTYQVGMAPNAQWIACKGCESSSCSDAALNACADWIVAPNGNPDNRPNVVNNSWGGGGGDTWYLAKVQAWHAAGIFPAFSAGNSGSACSSLGSPGDYQESFGTAAHDNNRTVASFSSRGPSYFGDDPYTKPNISAPGVSICSSVPGSGWDCTYSGTSMSSPHSAGAVALLWSCNSSLIGDMQATFEVLQNTADPAPDGNCGAPTDGEGNYTYGYGYLNVLAAGQWVCSAGTITGSVTSGGSPVEGATVTADNGEGVVIDTETGADGIYTLNAPAGTYTVTATKYGFTEDIETGVVVEEDGTVVVDFTIEPLASTIVSGVVYDAGVEGLGNHGYPLYASIRITATGFDQTIYSDPITGEYSVELVSETEHTFEVNSVISGYEPFAETLTPTGATLTYDIGLGVDGGVCAAPGYQPDYDFFWSFEQSDGGFTPGGTTSFAWGDFTSGPGEGHSGTKGIATNPAGNYNPNELGYMLSPVIDLSGYGTNTPVIQWWDWKDIESVSWDWARFDVTKDGGATWTTVWGPVGGVHDTEYHQQTVVLDPSYNVSDFQFRFYFKSDSSVQYAGWYVDDVGLVEVPVPPATQVFFTNFDSDNGGFVASGTNSSWAWGAPSAEPGPGAPYSAPNVWATNLAGNYNNSEESYITSPVIDLSAHAGLAPVLSFYHWMESESNTWDWGSVEATKDGGVTWDIIWQKFGNITEWTPKSLQLDPSYAVSNFQFRFHFHSDGSINYPGWYIDDVGVSVSEPFEIAAPCVVIPGGAVAGYVTDEMTSEPLIGADVYSETAATVSFVLEDDPDNAGVYWLFQPTETDPEEVLFTASKDLYADETARVSVVQDDLTQQDFALGTGQLTFDPTEFEFTMAMGDAPATDTLTIGNNGTSDATFELVEKEEGFTPLSIPAFTGELPEDNREVSLGRAPQAATNVSRSSSAKNDLGGILSTAPAFAMDIYPGEKLVYIPDTSVPGTWEVVGSISGMSFFAGDFVGGDFDTMYVVNYDNNGLYAVDIATGAYTQIGTTTPPLGTINGLSGTPDGTMYGIAGDCSTSYLVTIDIPSGATTNIGSIPGVGCGIDLAYNTDDDMIYVVDLLTDSLFRVDPATAAATLVGALGVSPNYAQGMDFEEESGVLYWAAYTTSGELRVIDTTTGASTLIGAFPGGAEVDCLAFPTGGSADVPWLSEYPVSGTVPAGETVEVTIAVDPSGLGQPGDYAAALKVKHNTPYTYPNIPVILHLIAPEDFGTINGTVYGLEACDINPAPIEGATVNFKQEDVIIYSTTTLADGYYSYSMPEGVYDIEVIAEGFVSQTVTGVDVVVGSTVTQDFELRLLAPCLSAVPSELEKTLVVDQIGTQTLTLVNTGTVDVDIELIEMDQTPGAQAQISIPAFTGQLPDDDKVASIGPAPKVGNAPAMSGETVDLSGIHAGEPAFAMDIYPGENLVYIPDTTAPGTWEIIGPITGMSFFAGDFVGGDFDTMYVVNYDNNGLYTVNTTTGAYTQIGTTTPPSGTTFSGLTGAPDGTMYGLTTSCSTSYLVTVDVTTGATTVIGSLTGVGCGIDLAFNTNDGMIYTVDLLTDNVYKIDPETAQVTLVGPTGISANYAQGMDYEEESGVLYWAAFNYSTYVGELRIIDTTTGASTLIGMFPGGAETDCLAFTTGGISDVPWLSEDPVAGTVPAGGSLPITVTFDATGLDAGDYFAGLRVRPDGAPRFDVPVTLHVVEILKLYLPIIAK